MVRRMEGKESRASEPKSSSSRAAPPILARQPRMSRRTSQAASNGESAFFIEHSAGIHCIFIKIEKIEEQKKNF